MNLALSHSFVEPKKTCCRKSFFNGSSMVGRGWMHIDILWVDENFRKKGIGSQLLKAAEEEARKRGCHSVHVDTMSWQAPDFYKKHGYKIISELNDIPKGNKKYHLIKELNIL